MIAGFLYTVRADIIPEVMAFPRHIPRVEAEIHLLAGAVEVMQDAQSLGGVQLRTLGAEGGKVRNKISAGAGKICASFLHILFHHGDGDILLLDDAIALRGLVHEHLVILLAVHIPLIPAQGHEDGLLKVHAIEAAVVDRNLGGRPGVQAVQRLGISQKHGLLICAAGHKIVDVREAVHLGKLVAHQKDTVCPDALDGDHILHPARDAVFFLVLLQQVTERFYHAACRPPFHGFRWCPSAPHSRGWKFPRGAASAQSVQSAATPG